MANIHLYLVICYVSLPLLVYTVSRIILMSLGFMLARASTYSSDKIYLLVPTTMSLCPHSLNSGPISSNTCVCIRCIRTTVASLHHLSN